MRLRAFKFIFFAYQICTHWGFLTYNFSVAGAEFDRARQWDVVTNLMQLRQCAERKPFKVYPFRIVAGVLDANNARNALVLRDASGIEFVNVDLGETKVETGKRICLEGKGCGVIRKGFGLAIVPGLVVDNDGLHEMKYASGSVCLCAGLNPIMVQCFNGLGTFGLRLEYEGPGFPAQPIPTAALCRGQTDIGGTTNFLEGLEYRFYDGLWVRLPSFAELRPSKMGVTSGFEVPHLAQNGIGAAVLSGYIRIPHTGIYTFHLWSDDGSRLFVGEPQLEVSALPGAESRCSPPETNTIVSLYPNQSWVALEGRVSFVGIGPDEGVMILQVGDHEIQVRVFEPGSSAPDFAVGTRVRAVGLYEHVVAEDSTHAPGILRVCSWDAIERASLERKDTRHTTNSPTSERYSGKEPSFQDFMDTPLTTAAEIKALPPDLAKRQLPVSIRGVVTAVLPEYLHGAVIHDATKGVFVSLQEIPIERPMRVGEVYQVDGVTDAGLFAPIVIAKHVSRLGIGRLPQPLRATREQLRNGSLDTQYTEITGVVTAVHGQEIHILTEGGKIRLVIDDFQPADLGRYKNALIQIRGCAFATFNVQTRELDPSALRIIGGAISVLRAAPHDLFMCPQKNLSELLLYDPEVEPFRRVKISAQITYYDKGICFLTDGTNGIKVKEIDPNSLEPGDLVEAVGFVNLESLLPELTEAVLRKIGDAPLPTPRELDMEQLLMAKHAGAPVRVRATLINHWRDGLEQVLELQSALVVFRARIRSHSPPFEPPPIGSKLEITGVYMPVGTRTSDGKISGFELLVHSPMNLRLLAKPSWWTLKRVLALAGALAVILVGVLLWNLQLRLQVEERARQLEVEIRHRQQAELEHATEAERTRIARDLHDELGAGLTEIALLASTPVAETRDAGKQNDRLRLVAERARALVSELDVIVWAVDPKRDSLESFVNYVASYAREFLGASQIVCRLRLPVQCDPVVLRGPVRHSLFLGIKEALNNVVRHAAATEVELQISQVDDNLQIIIADNGRGFDPNTVEQGHGLRNLHERIQALGGQCQIDSRPGNGTAVKFTVPLVDRPT